MKALPFFLLLLLPGVINLNAQNPDQKKAGTAVRTASPPKLDGKLDEECWNNSNIFTGFRQYEPYSGEDSRAKTIVRLLYDDEGIYVGAINYDIHPDSIRRELGPRDGDRNIIADYFNVDIVPYNDGINGYSFKLTASGVQSDIRRSSGAGGRDLNWDAVWYSAVEITDEGWVAEIKIPFSAIRFPNEGDAAWGFNFWRYIQRYGEWSSWNWADKSHGTTINYMGELRGINGVTPPPRISVTPYLSAHLENSLPGDGLKANVNGGADLKVGIGEAFTLDATLIPDFSQVQSDDRVLNLSPYEVKYNERRQFFTEGTDVFNKGGIFYSRRIGSRPSGYGRPGSSLAADEEIAFNPQESRLINATKISGRTGGGLGIGFFNGITAPAVAEIYNTLTGESRQLETQALTNYNMLVLDQNLGGGSYISLVNTNVLRKGSDIDDNYTANVTATDFRYIDKTRTWSIDGIASLSQKYWSDRDDIFGHSITVRGGKTGGGFRAYHTFAAISDSYDPNDMGYLRRNNELNNSLTLGYNIYKPVWKVLNSLNNISLSHNMLHTPRVFTSSSLQIRSVTTFSNLWLLSLETEITPGKARDYYEPRITGRFYLRPPDYSYSVSMATDNRRVLSAIIAGEVHDYKTDYKSGRYHFSLSPTLRINNNLIFSHAISLAAYTGDTGYTGIRADSIIFGRRNTGTVENIFSFSYIHSPRSYIDLRIRHYWSKASYNSYYLLNSDGSLTGIDSNLSGDINTNYFNIDMGYSWRFSPGSELKFVWKNSTFQSGPEIYTTFKENLRQLLSADAVNTFSLKILYYLDYHSVTTSRR